MSESGSSLLPLLRKNMEEKMLFEECSGRLLRLLCYVGYCIEFPKFLASHIGGHPDWCRHVMYKAIEEGYVEVFRKETSRRVVTSLRITDKGLNYIAVRNPEVFMMIEAKTSGVRKGSHSTVERILRYQSFATALVMADNAGALVLPDEKPPLMYSDYSKFPVKVDPEKCYFYSTAELRAAIQAFAPDINAKGSRIVGVLVYENSCFCIYDTGRRRMFWMRSTEENFASTVESLLNTRGFKIDSLEQVVLGDRIGVVSKVCCRKIYKGTRYFVLSTYFNSCSFVTKDAAGELQLRALWDRELAFRIDRRALARCRPPDFPTREYDAVDAAEGRPVVVNYTFNLLSLPDIGLITSRSDGPPIILCFDHQVQTMQKLVGTDAEVRGIGGTEEYEKEKN